jgi:hypothetical protein
MNFCNARNNRKIIAISIIFQAIVDFFDYLYNRVDFDFDFLNNRDFDFDFDLIDPPLSIGRSIAAS